MNQNKKNNGWVLCPSKSFSGKCYYFNVVTGEAVWSLNELENPSLRRDYRIHKVTDKSHSFPEPLSPPMDDTPKFSFSNNASFKRPNNINFQKRVIHNTQTPMFGQAIIPQYVDPYMPNVIWAPIQLPTPMYYPNTPYMGMKMPLDRSGSSRDPDLSIFAQSCNLSLSKRFEMYANSSDKSQKKFNKFYETSTPIKSSFNEMSNSQIFGSKEDLGFQKPNESKANSFIREPIIKRVRTVSDSKNNTKDLSGIYKTNSSESLINLDHSALMKPTLSESNNVEKTEKTVNKLASDDLRYHLEAKRSKSVDLADTNTSCDSRKVKTTKTEVPKTTPKKKVTFNDQIEQNIGMPEGEDSPGDQNIEDCLLYIAVDLDTLLDEYEFVEEYIQSDDRRRLLIPHKLQSGIEAVCMGDCRGRRRVVAARQITRKLVTPPRHYVLLPESEDSPNSVQCLVIDNNTDSYILNACLMVLNAGAQVMLVTNNEDLSNDAKALNIDCFKPQELKDGAGITKPEVSFHLEKLPFDSTEKNTNLFLQLLNDIQPCLVKNTEEIPIKKRLFDDEAKNSFPKSPSASNNKIFSDKLIDITRKKPNMTQTENATTQIGLDMQNLFIKDKPKNDVAEKQNTNVTFENGTEKRKESKQKGFEPRSMDRNSLDELLNAYSVKNVDMIENIKIRFDEFVCCFTQILEDALIEVLRKHSPIEDTMSPPWVLYETVKSVQDLYGSHTDVVMVTAKLKDMLLNHSSKTGKLSSSIKPNDFVKVVGCGLVLIETLKSIEDFTPSHDASKSLADLLQSMSHPPIDIPLFTTPVFTRDEETVKENRRNHTKKPSEIIEYLKTHYPDWKDFETPVDIDDRHSKIVRTTGRDLSLLKIDNNKLITWNKRTVNTMKAVNIGGTQNSTKIDCISTIVKPNFGENYFTKSPIVFRKFDTSFICKIDSKKPIPSRNDINIINKVDIFSNNKASIETKHDGEPKTTEKDKISSTKSNDIFSNDTEPKVIRIFDHLFKQNNGKATTAIDEDLNESKHGNTFGIETAGPKVIRTFSGLFTPKDKEKSITTDIIKDLTVPKHGNTFDHENETAGPKVIRNIKPIEAFEGKLKENSITLDLDALDYSDDQSEMIDDEDSIKNAGSFVFAIDKTSTKFNEEIAEFNDNALDNVKEYTQKSDDQNIFTSTANDSFLDNCSYRNNESNDKIDLKDDTNDSGFENENIHAYKWVKIFLVELTQSFKESHEFIVKILNEYREGVQKDKKMMLYKKAHGMQMKIALIIDELKSIIQRESNEHTALVREVLLKAGVQASRDKRLTRYRQVITKCLEQAQLIENALKTVLKLTNYDINISVSGYSDESDIRYYNIFE